MKIRNDFASASLYLERLLLFGHVFHENNVEHWSHLKNREDFKNIFELDDEVRYKFEKVYSVGRDLAVYMSRQLDTFNDPSEHPTLTSYVKSFDNSWLTQIAQLQEISQTAKDEKKKLEYSCPWAVEQMIILFDKQVSLLQDIIGTLNIIKTTDIYKIENGEPVMKNGETNIHHEYNFSGISNSAVNINSPDAKASVQSLDGLKETILQLSDIFQKAQFSDKAYQEQSLEILESILEETQKLKPKKFSIASMISTLSSLASLATTIDKNVPALLEKIKNLL